MNLLRRNVFFANAKNGSFSKKCIQFLAHVVSQDGVIVDSDKIQAVLNWPLPGDAKELRGFLGLIGYYRCFVKCYGMIARPLTDLTKKNVF